MSDLESFFLNLESVAFVATPRLATRGVFEDKEQRPRGNKHSEGETTQRRIPTMGDRSPKSVQKQASQKQSKVNDSNQKKQAIVTSQQATKAKAAANKKK